MASPALRTQPIDRRRLSKKDRGSYNPSNRLSAISRVKAFKAMNSFNKKAEPFRTERTPGTGGLVLNQLIARNIEKGQEERRAKSFRKETILPK